MYKDFRNEKPDDKKGVMDDVSLSNMLSFEALVNLLIKKGICTKEEVIEETKKVKERWELMKGIKLE